MKTRQCWGDGAARMTVTKTDARSWGTTIAWATGIDRRMAQRQDGALPQCRHEEDLQFIHLLKQHGTIIWVVPCRGC